MHTAVIVFIYFVLFRFSESKNKKGCEQIKRLQIISLGCFPKRSSVVFITSSITGWLFNHTPVSMENDPLKMFAKLMGEKYYLYLNFHLEVISEVEHSHMLRCF